MEIRIKKAEPRGEESEFVRQFKARPAVFIGTVFILVIVVIAFVFVPVFVPESSGAGGSLVFGSWNGTPIAYVPGNYFAMRQRETARTMQNSIDESNYQSVSYLIWRQAFEDTAVRLAMLDAVKTAGYTPPEDLVDRRVAGLPDFQENGRFSSARWNSLATTDRLNVWRETRDSLAVERYVEDITSLRIPAAEMDFIAAMGKTRRSFDFVAIPLASWPAGELAAFAGENAALFITVHLSRLTVKSEREARQIRDQVAGGTTAFEDAAKLHSTDSRAAQGGDLGLRMAYELTGEIENGADREAAAGLKEGELSAPIKVEDGWAFFRAQADPRPADLSDAATLEKIRSYVMNYERGRVEDWVIADAHLFIESLSNNGLAQAAFFRGLEVKTFGPLPLNFGPRAANPWGYETDGVDLFPTLSSFSLEELRLAGGLEIFWKSAFATPPGEPSAPFVAGNNVLILVPRAEEEAGEEVITGIRDTYTSWWVSNNIERGMRNLFLSSDKLTDRFMMVYYQNSGAGL
ncbi:MAG: peptidylprolyl isomerase [Spirochaetaceae bacterium]|jgi:hypothetical protein|nr:peptidylprolyl isomerase [Spirochaetaceae bacterium]